MNFPKFWAKASQDDFICWRWSNVSLADAQRLADEFVRKMAERIRASGWPTDRYGYGERPLREEVIGEFKDTAGNVTAVVTRNTQGCLVLNTANMLFVDIDFPQQKPIGLLKKLFGKPEPPPSQHPLEARVLSQAESWAQAHPGWGWRVYRTRAGLRLLATHALFNAEAAETDAMFEQLGADPLYRRLCKAQKCFRARLTPKPWRCGLRQPRTRWPFLDEKSAARFKQWETRYTEACQDKATCALITTYGNPTAHAAIQPLLTLHDETTRANSSLPLA
jgi:hypothetical protein